MAPAFLSTHNTYDCNYYKSQSDPHSYKVTLAVTNKAQKKFWDSQLELLHNCEDHFHLYSLSAVLSYDLYNIHIVIMSLQLLLQE